jgi:hypothetical protein
MAPSKVVKEYKEELIKSQEQNERFTVLVWAGQSIVSVLSV